MIGPFSLTNRLQTNFKISFTGVNLCNLPMYQTYILKSKKKTVILARIRKYRRKQVYTWTIVKILKNVKLECELIGITEFAIKFDEYESYNLNLISFFSLVSEIFWNNSWTIKIYTEECPKYVF